MSVTENSTTQPLETKFSNMSLKNNNDNNNSKDQPLRRSDYNIYEACDTNTISQDASNLIEPYSIHPLQKVSDAYSLDLSSPNCQSKNQKASHQEGGELNSMMEDLNLSPNNNTSNLHRQRSMPYCV